MKVLKLIFPLFCLTLVCACSKTDSAATKAPVAAQEATLEVVAIQPGQLPDCALLLTKLEKCEPSFCIANYSAFGVDVPIVNTIQGFDNARKICLFTQSVILPNGDNKEIINCPIADKNNTAFGNAFTKFIAEEYKPVPLKNTQIPTTPGKPSAANMPNWGLADNKICFVSVEPTKIIDFSAFAPAKARQFPVVAKPTSPAK